MGKVNVKYLGPLADIVGKKSEFVEIDQASVSDLLDSLKNNYGAKFEKVILDSSQQPKSEVMILVNGRNTALMKGMETELNDGDVVSLVVAVSGG